MTQVAQCAKEIRKILKGQFPEIKFSVRSENYSNGNSVHVEYYDAIPEKEIEKWISGYQYGHFDGMTDMYEYSNSVEGRPQTKYLFVNRHISPEYRQQAKEKIAKDFGIKEIDNEQEWKEKFGFWSDQIIWRELRKARIKNGNIIYADYNSLN